MSYGVGLRNGVAFALGTIPSLTSGGGLRPSLTLNFLSGSLDSRVTFSRGTQAMQYGSDGTLQYAPNNLLTYSNQADNAAWTKSNSFVQTNLLTYSQQIGGTNWITSGTGTATVNSAVAPDGTFTATRIVNTGAFSEYQTVTVTASTSYVFSFYAKNNGGTIASYRVYNNTGSADIIPITSYFSSINDTSYTRITVAFTTPVGCTSVLVYVHSTGSAGGDLLTWGSQLVQGSVPGDYRATTSAALPVLYADYNGALRARKLCENNVNTFHLLQNNQATVGATQTLSVYAKAGERTQVSLQIGTSSGYFNLTTGTVVSGTNASIISIGGGWYRCVLGGYPVAINSNCFVSIADAGNITYAGDGSSGIYIADAQLTPGYLPLAVTETTSAAVYGPRFDYDPVTKVSRGLLIEEQRTNLVLYSDQFDNAAWTKTRCSVTANNATSPEGVANADKLVEDGTAASTHPVSQAVTVTAAAQTASCYLKAAERTWAQINLTGTANAFANFNLATGAIGTIGAAATATITAIANGWYRCTITSTTAAGANTFAIYPATGDNVISYNGDGVSGLYVYGAQLE